MRIDDLRPTSNSEDGAAAVAALGLGVIGLLIVIVVAYFAGIDPREILSQIQGIQPAPQQTAQQQAADAKDPSYIFARKIVGSAEDVWTPILKARGVAFTPATLTVYEQMTPTGCGFGASAMGAVLLPGRQPHLSRPRVLQRALQPLRRAGTIRAGLCDRA